MHSNVVKIFLNGTFDEKKVKYVSDSGVLLKRTWYFLNGIILPWPFNRSERCSFWKIFCIILIFFTTKSEEFIWLHYCKLCNRLILNQLARQYLAPSQISNSESFKHTCRSFWQYCIALVYQVVFLPDITTYRHRRNGSSWTYHMCQGIKTYPTYPTNVIF